MKACQDLPGQQLFQYVDEDGDAARRRPLATSTPTCARSPARTSPPRTSAPGPARCWRRWRCASSRRFDSEAAAKKNVRAAIESVAGRLGNTPTICRKCYIHPQILDCYLEGGLLLQVKGAVESELSEDLSSLRPEEAAVLGLLQARLSAAETSVKVGAPAKRAGALGRGAKAARGTAAAKTATGSAKSEPSAKTKPSAKSKPSAKVARGARVRKREAAA